MFCRTLLAAGIGEEFFSHFQNWLAYLESHLGRLLWNICVILAILAAAKLLLAIFSKCTDRMMKSPRYHQSERQGKRIDTMMTLMRSVARYAIYCVAALMIFSQLGFGTVLQNLLVTAGIGSIAIGFGAQSLVKDVVTGLFMMFENQFAVGDYIKTGDVEGTVEATAMRVTYVRVFTGQQVIIPNGLITQVTNYSRGNALAVVVIATPYEEDSRRMMGVIQQAAQEYADAHPDLVEEAPRVQGIVELAGSSVNIRLVCKTKPMAYWEVERGLRLAVKERFDQLGISFPYPHLVAVQEGQPQQATAPAEK
ncbi:MAG TPA: mechanosensitive ion channel family protein [Candidatus Anaerotruncus excrementipullorum]|uniref:Mechanosensitive ion channel family protein n=1 Tax=Candidatus Anaerotruncus excrementipullorum TaxID=2838465 RepID=A0A9D1WR76_9FIRM|nr:mechanosensitive ion channel family protein [Candidatus Anaerotruncus excrementipullorum]